MSKQENVKILSLMFSKHIEISKQLDELNKNSSNVDWIIENSYHKFKQMVDNHFTIEEEAIFSFCNNNDCKYAGLEKLVKQHNIMRGLIDELGSLITNHEGYEITELQKILVDHRREEEDVFYPILDKTLDSEQRNYIINKILTLS